MNRIFLSILAVFFYLIGEGQILTSIDAVSQGLENNYGIKLSQNASTIAQNNTSKFNTGELPTVRVIGGTDYGLSGSEINYHADGIPASSVWVSNGLDYNAAVSAEYLIYDFGGRSLNKQKLHELLDEAKLEEKRSMELNILSILISYYSIAQISDNLLAQQDLLNISKNRKERIRLQQQYGKNNKLALLNAEVDINRDSIDFLNLIQELENEKRNFNLLLGRDVNTTFDIDSSLQFKEDLDLEQLMNEALNKNIDLLLLKNDQQIGQLDIDINNRSTKPRISANSSLGLFGGLNDNQVQVKNQFGSNLSAGLSLSWNLFDGGSSKIRDKNLRVFMDNLTILETQQTEMIRKEVKNTWESYQNQMYVMSVEKRNIETAKLNFDRTEEQFKLGQISSVEFRQAQLNMLFARINFNRTRFLAKIHEIKLLKLSGNILEGI